MYCRLIFSFLKPLATQYSVCTSCHFVTKICEIATEFSYLCNWIIFVNFDPYFCTLTVPVKYNWLTKLNGRYVMVWWWSRGMIGRSVELCPPPWFNRAQPTQSVFDLLQRVRFFNLNKTSKVGKSGKRKLWLALGNLGVLKENDLLVIGYLYVAFRWHYVIMVLRWRTFTWITNEKLIIWAKFSFLFLFFGAHWQSRRQKKYRYAL